VEEDMSVAKVIEVIAEGKSLENAMEAAIKEASDTVRGIKSLYVDGIQAIVENNKIINYRVNVKITFVIE
jgi:flavin-binding protein dodecin